MSPDDLLDIIETLAQQNEELSSRIVQLERDIIQVCGLYGMLDFGLLEIKRLLEME